MENVLTKTRKELLEDLPLGIKQLFTSITHLKEGEKVLVITDENKKEIGEFVYKYAKEFFETTMMVMPTREGHGAEPTEAVRAAMNNCDVAFGATTYSMYHSKARLDASKNGRLRWVGLQDYALHMFEKGGLTADFDEVKEVIDRVSEYYQGNTFKLTAPGGTNMVCSVKGRKPVFDYGTSREPGSASFPPNAEVALGPVEGTANGVLVFDGSIPHPLLNLLDEPVICKVENGFITEITGGREADILRKILADFNDPTVYNIAELGLGLNKENYLCGHMAPDEGSLGNIHIGIGKNLNFGGHVDSPLHLDLVIKDVTVVIDDCSLMKDGELLV
ncbi:aminopeptidase [Sporosarcina soli]|uniref:Aminopeptidase n=1 Tax=Sporosarcina soli TaxID=334736 RepID=A0ABW0TKR0_9BACL